MPTTDHFANKNLLKYFKEIVYDNLSLDNLEEQIYSEDNESINNTCEPMCESCKNTNLMNDISNGIVVCMNCGEVLEGIIDFNPEWKNYEDDQAIGRCGGMPINPLLPQSSLGTTIQGMGYSRLKLLNQWNSMPYKERSLNKVFKKISEICSRNNILKCIEDDAKIMYKTVSESIKKGNKKKKFVITRGINRIGVTAACVLYACKRKNMTRTPREISEMFGLTLIEMNRGCKHFLKLMEFKKFNMNIGVSNSEQFIRRHCNKLRLKTMYTEKALEIARNINNLNIASVHTPPSLAAASILLMAEFNGLNSITKKKLANEFEVSEVTIGKTYKKIEPYRHIVCNNQATSDIVENIDTSPDTSHLTNELLNRMKQFGIGIEETICDEIDVDNIDNKLDDSINEIYMNVINYAKKHNSNQQTILNKREIEKKEIYKIINLIRTRVRI